MTSQSLRPIYPRPTSVAVIAILHFVLAIVSLTVAALGDVTLAESLLVPNIRPGLLRLFLLVNGLLTLGVGVVMWRGFRFGWFVSVAAFIASAVRNIAGIIVIEDVLDEFGMPMDGLQAYYIAYATRAILAGVCVQLFITRPVADFFNVDERRERMYIILITAACLGLAVGAWVLRTSFV